MDVASMFAELQRRLRKLEDKEEIARLIAAYGPCVDSGAARETAELWTTDGTYTYGLGADATTLRGQEALAEMVEGSMHQSIITGGAGHFLGSPHIELDGDDAVATCYSMLVRHDPTAGRYYVDRLSSNRWALRRTEVGWRVESRVNELLDGSSGARDLLGRAVRVDPGRA